MCIRDRVGKAHVVQHLGCVGVQDDEDETELEHRISELYETMYRELYEFYRDELSEQLLPRCTCGANTYCRCRCV